MFLLGVGCAIRNKPAPIVNATTVPPSNSTAQPKIEADKAEAIADNPKLAAIEEDNNDVQETAVTKRDVVSESGTNSNKVTSDKNWIMPTKGDIIQKFKPSTKGINIAGVEGQDIKAIGEGKVLYSGNGLKGYGNLIIIKHDSTYLSAYAHNKVNSVKQGVSVKSGQKIAEMGKSSSGRAMLHFEIRKNGKPIDPLTMISN